MSMLHLPLPSLSSYAATHALQTHLVSHLLNLKALSKRLPPSLVLTMELLPTYTFGRRQQITPEDRASLSQVGSVIKSQRGGLTTYHGPGQVVGYPILDLKRHGLTPRCYVNALESSIIKLCSEFGIKGFRTKDTGVWCSTAHGDRKIASIGVHLRRNITSHGVGINVTEEIMPYFDRIDACGLAKGVASFESMGVRTTIEEVEKKWVQLLGKEVGADVQTLSEVGELEQIWGLKDREVVDAMLKGEIESQPDPKAV